MRNALKNALGTALSAAFKNNILSRYFIKFSAAAGSHARVDTINLNAGDTVIIKSQMDAGTATRYLIDGDDANERCFAYISYTTQLIKLSSTRVDPNSVLLDGVAVTGDIPAPNDGKIHTLQFTVSQPCKIGYIACRYSVASFLDQIFMSLQVVRDTAPIFLDFDVAPGVSVYLTNNIYSVILVNIPHENITRTTQHNDHMWLTTQNIYTFKPIIDGSVRRWGLLQDEFGSVEENTVYLAKIDAKELVGECALRIGDASASLLKIKTGATTTGWVNVNSLNNKRFYLQERAETGTTAEEINVYVYKIFEVA